MKFLRSKSSAPRIGTIMLIVTLLLSSAGLRVGLSATQALAKPDPKDDAAGHEMEQAHDTEAAGDAHAPNMPETEAEMGTLLSAIREREAKITARETRLDMRAKALDVAQHEIERRLEALEEVEARLRATLAQADTATEGDVARLTAVYENMKAKDAAILFEEMEPKFAAGFLGRMRPDAAAGIMTGLSAQKAYTISIILAGRNAKVPKS